LAISSPFEIWRWQRGGSSMRSYNEEKSRPDRTPQARASFDVLIPRDLQLPCAQLRILEFHFCSEVPLPCAEERCLSIPLGKRLHRFHWKVSTEG